jgi:hypothetical protein
MEIEVGPDSLQREADLRMITAVESYGLIVVDLPASLRFAEPGELPSEMEITYRTLRVRKGCRGAEICSVDGLIGVVPIDNSVDLSGVGVRSVPK